MPDPQILLFADCESTGVLEDPETPTILEAAWALTDTDGTLLTPIRQRFTALPAAQHDDAEDRWRAHAPMYWPATGHGRPTNDDATVRWASEDAEPDDLDARTALYPVEFVRDMHARNGLDVAFADFATVQGDHMLAIGEQNIGDDELNHMPLILRWTQLDRLMRTDLDAAGAPDLERGQVILAGGGVSHYENRFLRRTCPATFDPAFMHYSAGADLSTVLRTLSTRLSSRSGTERVPHLHRADHLLDWARTHPDRVPSGWDSITLAEHDAGPDSRWTDLARPDDPAAAYLHADVDSHRAVAGVARAIAGYRLLPHAAEFVLSGWHDTRDLETVSHLEARR